MNYAEQIHRLAAPHGAAVITTTAAAEIAAQADAEIERLNALLDAFDPEPESMNGCSLRTGLEIIGEASREHGGELVPAALAQELLLRGVRGGREAAGAEIKRLRTQLAALVDAAIPFANAHFPDERELLGDAQYLAINQAVAAADDPTASQPIPNPEQVAPTPDLWEVAKAFVLSAWPEAWYGLVSTYGWSPWVVMTKTGGRLLANANSEPAAWLDAALNVAKGRVVNQYPDAVSYMFDGGVTIRDNETGNYFALGTGPTEALAWLDAARRLEGNSND